MSPVFKETGFVLFVSFPFEFKLLLDDPFAEEISKPFRHHDRRSSIGNLLCIFLKTALR